MTEPDAGRVQAYLRRLLGTDRVRVVAPRRAGMSAEVAAGDGEIGTLHRDVEDGEASYAVHPTKDLPPAAQPAPAPPAPRRRR